MEYEFRFFLGGSEQPVTERKWLADDRAAVVRAAGELIQMPGRTAVEVWRDKCLVYRRQRGERRWL